MKPIAQSFILALALVLAPTAFAQHQIFTVNPDASKVAFSLGGNGHHVDGTFHVQSGSIDFDRSAQTIAGSVVVAAGSGDSGESSRDKKMNSDVLDVAHFAEVSFVPRSYQGTVAASGDSTIQVTGIFTLHGTPHDLTVPMQIHIDGTTLTAKTHFTVPYVQWGLKDPSIFILKVAKVVDIDLTLVGSLSYANLTHS
ncbi:MAG: YceI family protein [Terracidiphilus sp.]|jgi:polyisoprenoid-binding protein YceI